MNILIVTANPKAENHTKQIAETYKTEKEKLGDEVRLIDLYAEENMIPYFLCDKNRDAGSADQIEKMHEHITWANEIVVVHPVWWGLMPAAMKNWMDEVFGPHFAYQYDKGGKEIKMLTGKTAKVFATAGSNAPYFRIPIVKLFTPLHLIWKYALFGFCGIELVDFQVCDQMNMNNGCPPVGRFENFLEEIKHSARKIK